MDSTSSNALLKPRLRLFRRSPSPRNQETTSETTPQPGPSAARPLAWHDDGDDFPTPRVQPRPIASINGDPASTITPVPAETPAARLRALLAREPRSPSTTPAPPSSDADSIYEPSYLGSSTSSVARSSLKDIFSRALREPGDTPEKGRFRRNSFDGSSMEITPVVDGKRGLRKPARKSLSDEETDKPKSSRRSSPSFRLSTAVTFDTLRARLMSSQSQLVDQNPPEALYEQSSLASTSTSNAQHQPQTSASSSQSNSAHITPSVATDIPQPSFQMSSQLAFQSNLLEQDSEMQRAMGDVLNSENEDNAGSTSLAAPSDPRATSSLGASKNNSKPALKRTSHELGPSTSGSSVNGRAGGDSQEEEHNHQREREGNRLRLSSMSSIPDAHRRRSRELHHRLSQEFRSPSHAKSLSYESAVRSASATPIHRHLERRGSLASLRSLDDDHSSRPSSTGSQSDYRDRISELDRERNYGREREWNKRHPPSRPSSSMSTSSNHSFTHAHTHPPRSPSATPYLTPTHSSLRRKSSRTSLRSDSPASLASSHDSLKERDEEAKRETAHERERNWNSPHPQWTISSSPSPQLKTQNKDIHSLRPRSSLPHLGGPNGHRDTSQASTVPHSTSPKADFPFPTSPHLARKLGDRSDLRSDESAVGTAQSTSLNGSSPGKSPGATSRFGWHFARSPLPPLELDDSENHHRGVSSPRASQATTSSQIPVRSKMKSSSSVGHATSDMSFTHVVGDESSLQRDYRDGLTENAELRSHSESPAARTSWSQDDVILGSDEESVNDVPPESTTPKSNPFKLQPEEIEMDTETEVLASPSPQGSPLLRAPTSIPSGASLQDVSDPSRSQTPNLPLEDQLMNSTPPGAPPGASASSEIPVRMSPSFSLVTPPRPMSLSSTSILDFRTPSPPQGLPDLPAPPLSSDDDMLGATPTKDHCFEANSNFTLTKTPKPPGAWTATPLPPELGNRLSSPADTFSLGSTPPAFTSTPLPRATTLPHTRTGAETDSAGEDGLLTPVGPLSRASSLPLRTPAPPGAWMATPAQSALLTNGADQSQYGSLSRRKGLLKVRFDVAESETSATEGHPNSPLSAIRLVNYESPPSKLTVDEEVMNGVSQPASSPTVWQRPATPERHATPTSRESAPSPRSLRKSPSVRLVDAFGRERVSEESTVAPPIDRVDGEKITTSPLAARRSLVRIVDAMGREVVDAAEIPSAPEDRNKSIETGVSFVSDDTPLGHADALARMRKTLEDLAESLSDADRSEDLELNSSHIEQLEEVSQAARFVRNQLAHNLHVEATKEHDLHRNNKFSAWTRGLLPTIGKGPWITIVIYCGVIMQTLLVLAMWRYAHAEARRLFFTTYYDPVYPEYTPILGGPCLSGTLSISRPWTMTDLYKTIRREGWWSIGTEMLRGIRHVADQAWELWGEHASLENPS